MKLLRQASRLLDVNPVTGSMPGWGDLPDPLDAEEEDELLSFARIPTPQQWIDIQVNRRLDLLEPVEVED